MLYFTFAIGYREHLTSQLRSKIKLLDIEEKALQKNKKEGLPTDQNQRNIYSYSESFDYKLEERNDYDNMIWIAIGPIPIFIIFSIFSLIICYSYNYVILISSAADLVANKSSGETSGAISAPPSP